MKWVGQNKMPSKFYTPPAPPHPPESMLYIQYRDKEHKIQTVCYVGIQLR